MLQRAQDGSTPSAVRQLRQSVRGHVIEPGDAGYDEARAVFLGVFDRRPAIIARPLDAADVAAVVGLARETGLELAVRSGGHSLAGHSASEGGILLDLSAMRALDIDVEGRTAWAGPGLTAGEYAAATGAHGLATGFGDAGPVGIGGITLGGGVGFLVRKFGLTVDDLLAAEVVTADGRILHADAEHHPDLFWAIRGGGGNFGVVTRFRFRLHEVGTVLGGMLLLPATPDVIAGLVAEGEAAPEELSVIANVMPAPPMPFIPPEQHGQPVVIAMMVHTGPVEDGERAVAPFRALATPVADLLRPMAYHGMYALFGEEGEGPPVVAEAVRSLFADGVDRATAQLMLDHLRTSTAPMAAVQLRVLGGAMARVPAAATAFAHRDRRVMVNVAAVYENATEAPVHEAWADRLASALHPGAGVYVNFLGDEGADRVRDAYPGSTWDRLTAIKARYDPDNLFRRNHNIPPAPAERAA